MGNNNWSLAHPNAVEPRLRKLEEKVARMNRTPVYSSQGGRDGMGDGEDHSGGQVPPVDADQITVSITSKWSIDGLYTPVVSVSVDPDFEALLKQTPGFSGYIVRITAPTGEVFEHAGSVTLNDSGVTPDALGLRSLPPVQYDAAVGQEAWTAQVKVRNSKYGDGPLSDPVPFTLSQDTTTPPTPSAPFLSSKAGVLIIGFTPPLKSTNPQYSHTEIWKGAGDFTAGGLSSGVKITDNKTGSEEISWDNAADVANLYDTIKIRHVNKSGTLGALSPGSAITTALQNATKQPTENIEDGAITDAKVASGINGAKLSAGSVGDTQIGSGINGGKLTAGTVGTSQLASGAVTNAKIGALALRPSQADLGLPILYNGFAEIPDSTGTQPDAWTLSGIWAWDNTTFYSGTHSVKLGGLAGTHIATSPLFRWPLNQGTGLTVGIAYRLPLVLPVGGIIPRIRYYDVNRASVFTESLTDTQGGTTPIDPTAPTGAGWATVVMMAQGASVPSSALYAAIEIEIDPTNSNVLYVDSFVIAGAQRDNIYTTELRLVTSGLWPTSIPAVRLHDSLGTIEAGQGLYTGGLRTAPLTKTSAFTPSVIQNTYWCDASLAGFTVSLPAAASYTGQIWTFKKIDGTTNKVTIDGNVAETIDGILTYPLVERNQSVTLQSDGSNWKIIAQAGLILESDGTRWLGPRQELAPVVSTNSGGNQSTYSATTLISRFHPPTAEAYWVESVTWRVRVDTTNNFSNYWTLRVGHESTALGGSVDADVNTQAMTAGTAGTRAATSFSGNPMDFSTTSYFDFFLEVRKDTGLPGTLNVWGVTMVLRKIYS